MPSDLFQLLGSLGTALAAGFLVGAEREQRQEQHRFGGARTFPLYALTGALGMLLGVRILFALALGLGALLAIAYVRDTSNRGDMGMSTEIAALITFALGALCTATELPFGYSTRLLVVAAGATSTLGLLSIKQPLHGAIAQVSQEDVYATTKFLLLAVIVLPLLPNSDLGPWGALNPWQIGLLVVLISGIGFAGYVAIRIFGERRGLGLTGLLGGLASSTAVTLSFSGRAKTNPALVSACALAIVLASSTMFPRMLIEIYAVSPSLGRAATWPLLVAMLGGMGGAAVLYARHDHRRLAEETGTDVALRNPFSVAQALKFAALFTVVLLAARAASHYFAEAGTYLAAFLTGIADVDAIVLTLARLHERDALRYEVALDAAGIAAVTNTVSKVALATVLGGPRLGARVGGALAAALAAGTAVHFAIN